MKECPRLARQLFATCGGAPLVLAVLACLGTTPAAAQERDLTVDGRRVHVRVAGREHLGRTPVVVLEHGGVGLWAAVQDEVAKSAPVIAYDRAGFGGSAPDGQVPQPGYIAARLHRVLAATQLPPPYVLVGISWGGPLIRMFAARYPTEVAGLVYLDPTDLRTRAQEMAYLLATGYTPEGASEQFRRYRDEFAAYVRTFSGAARVEMEMIDEIESADAPEFQALPPPPPVPVSVLVAGKRVPEMWQGRPCMPQECFARWTRFRTEWLTPLLSTHPQSRLIVIADSGHAMPEDTPAAVVSEIRRVLAAR